MILPSIRAARFRCGTLALSVTLGWAVFGPGVPASSQSTDQSSPGSPDITEPASQDSDEIADPSIRLRGSVWRTKAGIVFLRTPIGTLTLSSKTTLKDLRASHEVRFWVHEHHAVVDILKKSDGSRIHRYLAGPMTPGSDAPNTLRWWTPDGDETTHVGTQQTRLAAFHEGDPLTVEVDDSHTIIGVHDLQYDLQISQTPPTGSDARVLLSGTILKLKSNFVFLRTPVGVVMVNSKIGVPHAKVGQSLTLRIDSQRVTVDLESGAPPLRDSHAPPSSTAPNR
ncbi:MAG: hypothetical protein P0111_02095 [Nitrospira sp.]|nr:hypothetical protein [Nitrospira sp.]